MNLTTFKQKLILTLEEIGFDVSSLRSKLDKAQSNLDEVVDTYRRKDVLIPLLDVDNLQNTMDSKVDKINGKGLSDTNYTQDEKTKLSTLESSKYRGQFTTMELLLSEFPEGSGTTWHENKSGFYADVDNGVGEDVVRYSWDNNDFIWVIQKGVSTQLTGAQVKTMYEEQPDTNVYTDDEKSKLFGVDNGAQVNTITGLKGSAETIYRVGDINIELSNLDAGVTDPLNEYITARDN